MAIIGTNGDLVFWRIYVSLDLNDLTKIPTPQPLLLWHILLNSSIYQQLMMFNLYDTTVGFSLTFTNFFTN